MAAGLGKTPGRQTRELVYKTYTGNLKWKTSLREDAKMVIFLSKDRSFTICSLQEKIPYQNHDASS